MRKLFKYLTLLATSVLVIYSVAWAIIIFSFTSNINNLYSNQFIKVNHLVLGEDYYIKFKKIVPTYNLTKFAIKIQEWQEEGLSSMFECSSPIEIGFNLVAQEFYISYNGQAKGAYKPLVLESGSKMDLTNYKIYCNFSLFELLKISLFKNRNWFELVNHINKFAVTSGKILINNLQDDKKVYELSNQDIEIKFFPQKYYKNLNDFTSNIPQRWEVKSHNSIVYNKFEGRRIAPNSIFYVLWKGLLLAGYSKFYVQTGASKVLDIGKDLEIGVEYAKFSNQAFESDLNFLYKGKITPDSSWVKISFKSNSKLKSGFFDLIVDYCKLIVPAISKTPARPFASMIESEVMYLKNNKDNFTFNEFENKAYQIDGDLEIERHAQSAKINLKRLSIFSDYTGLSISNDTMIDNLSKWKSNGSIIIQNFSKLVDLSINNFYNFGKLRMLSNSIKELHRDIAKIFVKNLIDNPNNPENSSKIEFNLESPNFVKSTIGAVKVEQLKTIYILSLYQAALKQTKDSSKAIELMNQVDPSIIINHKDVMDIIINTM